MRKVQPLLMLLLLVVFALNSCILDPKKEPPPKGIQGGSYKSLKEKDDVLFNLELSYNDRNITQYDRLLDPDFIFIFDPEDFASGQTPKEWDRTREIQATTNMFNRNYSGSRDPIRTISLVLTYVKGDLTWEATSPDSAHAGETWYQKTVDYDLTVETTGDTRLFAQDAQALFVIRWAVSDTDTTWKIVRWYDLGQAQ